MAGSETGASVVSVVEIFVVRRVLGVGVGLNDDGVNLGSDDSERLEAIGLDAFGD